MSKLKIIKAANKKGIKFDGIYFGSEPTPGELPKPSDSQALFRGRAQDEEPRVKHTCNMGVGCEETGICYADAQGEPERCGKQSSDSQTKVPEDEDDLPIGYIDWYNRYFARQAVDMHRFADCEEAWREAYKAAMRADREGS